MAQYPFMALFAFLVPRMLGPEIYGRYALFVSVVGLTASFLDLGITEISARRIPELQAEGSHEGIITYYSRMLGFKLTLDVAVVALAAMVLFFLRPLSVPRQMLVPLLIVIVISDVSAAAYGLMFGLNNVSLCSARDPLRRAISLVTVIVGYSWFGLLGALYSAVIVETLLAGLYVGFTRRWLSARWLAPQWRYVAPLLRYGALFYLSWGITNVWQRLGNSLIGLLQGDFRQIALFDLSNQIFLTAIGFTSFLITALAPVFTRLRLDGKDGKVVDWSRRIVTYNLMLCAAGAAAWLLLGDTLVPWLIGPQYRGIYGSVALLLCGAFPMAIVQLGLALAMAYAQPIRYLTSLCIAVVTFIVASLPLIPRFGALGCAAATLISCICCAVAVGIQYPRFVAHSLGPGLRAIIVAGVLLLPCWIYRGGGLRSCLLLVAFLIIYSSVLLLTRVIDREELRQAWAALRHRAD
ncbi:MAG TPA: oligosaccharide flippase family protein [Steroidobacteraceae bacterium]|nr:oligosaccharide flippase family protein [Steroidobacteraceae bacterium]